MKAQDILSSPPFIALGIALSRNLPTRATYGIARWVARHMARKETILYRTIMANLAHVLGQAGRSPDGTPAELDADELARRAEDVIYLAGQGYVDMFRARPRDLQSGRLAVRVNQDEWERGLRAIKGDRGTVLVGPHISNFDLIAQWLAAQHIDMQVLSLAHPDAGNRVMNHLRRARDIHVTPIDTHSLREAVARLRGGGLVVTGVDRPDPGYEDCLPFFGRPARLPTGHVRLALQTESQVLAACCYRDPDDVYSIRISEPLDMERVGGRRANVAHNARRVLAVIEEMILRAPDQWMMFLPVWDMVGRPCPEVAEHSCPEAAASPCSES